MTENEKRIEINKQDWIAWINSYGINDGVGYIPRLPISIDVIRNLLSLTFPELIVRVRTYFPDVAIANGYLIPPLIGAFIGRSSDYPMLYNKTHKDPLYPDPYIDDAETGT